MAEPPKKKQKTTQSFKTEYSEKWPCLTKSSISNGHAFCMTCSSDFSVAHAGNFDCRRHIESAKHKRLAELKKAPSIASMFKTMSAAPDNHSFSVIKAESLMTEFIAKHNLSLSVADQLPALLKKMCPDSGIARDMHCGRSKTTALVNEMATMSQENIIHRMRNNVFTVSSDGSNDMGSSKLFPLVVRTVHGKGVFSEVLSVPQCEGSATGEKIFSLIDNCFESNSIPWQNCIAIGCDNANVMTGSKGGVYGLCLQKNPNITLAGCPLHLIHIAAEKGANTLPINVNDLLVDIYYYFNKSAIRAHRFHQFQALYGNDQLKMLKHGSTRWLSTGRCLERLLENWDPLKDFFKSEESRKDLSKYARSKVETIREALQSRSTRLYAMFLRYATKPLETFLTVNQSDAPQISNIVGDCKQLIRSLMVKFLKPSAFGGNKPTEEVEYLLDYNKKSDKELLIGEQCQTFIANKAKNGLSDSSLKCFYTNVKKFFEAVVTYLLQKLPLKDKVLSKLAVCDPNNLTSTSITDIRYLLERFPVLIPSGVSVDDVLEEFANLQCSGIDISGYTRVDNFWIEIGKMSQDTRPMYSSVAKVMLGLLTIPHSSAHCERVFSCVRKIKTDQRSSLGSKLLESLLVIKHKEEATFDVTSLNAGQLKRLKGAYTASLSGK